MTTPIHKDTPETFWERMRAVHGPDYGPPKTATTGTPKGDERAAMPIERVIARARDAGRNVVHTVTFDGEVVGTRRSAHRYRYAICRWVKLDDTRRTVIVVRWSRNIHCSGRHFAVRVEDAPTNPRGDT